MNQQLNNNGKPSLEYNSLKEKNSWFKASSQFPGNKIDSKEQFDNWYKEWKKILSETAKPGLYFFRGAREAKHKLLTTSQRLWIEKGGKAKHLKYRDFFKALLSTGQKDPVLEKVFKFYNLNEKEPELPLISLMQHYKGPTPFLDWTYNIDVALYFATENLINDNSQEINNYCSVYRINNGITKIRSLSSLELKEDLSFHELLEKKKKGEDSPDRLVYLSDFEENKNVMNSRRAIYNQNIIPQEGLFIFNPSRTIPLEGYRYRTDGSFNAQIRCYNINKRLTEYIHEKLDSIEIKRNFIYPDLNAIMDSIKEKTVNKFFNP